LLNITNISQFLCRRNQEWLLGVVLVWDLSYCWLQPPVRPWTRSTQISGFQILWDTIVVCSFKWLGFRDIHYTAITNQSKNILCSLFCPFHLF
jgi:hypothetical protein